MPVSSFDFLIASPVPQGIGVLWARYYLEADKGDFCTKHVKLKARKLVNRFSSICLYLNIILSFLPPASLNPTVDFHSSRWSVQVSVVST